MWINLFFLSEREAVWLSDRLSCSLAALIDGDRNNDEIIDTIQLDPILAYKLRSMGIKRSQVVNCIGGILSKRDSNISFTPHLPSSLS